MFFNILTFHSYISGVYIWVFVNILVKINVEGVSLEMCIKCFFLCPKSQTGTTRQSSERYWTLLTKEYLSGVI